MDDIAAAYVLALLGIVSHSSDVSCQLFAFSRISLLGVLHLFLAYCDAPSCRKYILCGTDSRAFAFDQAASIALTIIFSTWLYTEIESRHIYSLIGHAEASLHRAHIWCLSTNILGCSSFCQGKPLAHFQEFQLGQVHRPV